jgi:hypothetical protein
VKERGRERERERELTWERLGFCFSILLLALLFAHELYCRVPSTFVPGSGAEIMQGLVPRKSYSRAGDMQVACCVYKSMCF